MAFGNASAPTKIYWCRAKPPRGEHVQLLHEQVRLAWRYRNDLVAQERKRREEATAITERHYPGLGALAQRAEQLQAAVEDERAKIRRENAMKRQKRGGKVPSLAALREARAEYKVARKAAFADATVKSELDRLDAEDLAERKRLRAESGLQPGTYLGVENSMFGARKGPPPQFVPWSRWQGKLSHQFQAHGDVPSPTWAELLAGKGGSRIQLQQEPLPPGAKPDGFRAKHPRYLMRWKVGALSKRGRGPIYVDVSFVLRREIPPDGQIKWVHLVRRRVGTHETWQVQFAIARPNGWVSKGDTMNARGIAGLDIGWRMIDGDLRIGYVVDNEGGREEIRIPAAQLARWRKPEELESIRDREFNAIRERFAAWLAANEPPEWLREATSSLAQWRAEARLAALVIRWRKERFAGDAEIFDALEAWRKQDKHLADWAGYQRRSCERWRLDYYRRLAARLRYRYATLAVEDTDWRALNRIPPAEDDTETINRRRWYRIASPGLLRQTLEQCHPHVVRVPAERTTTICSTCGAGPAEDWEPIRDLDFRCVRGHAADQDRNAATNIRDLASGAAISQ